MINAALAQGKGRRGMDWFLLSLVFGPVATLSIVVLDKVDASLPKREPPAQWVQVLGGGLLVLAVILAVIGRHH